MTETGRDVGSDLVEVSGSLLAELAQIDGGLLDAAIIRLLPPRTNAEDRPCGGTGSRLWENH
jgi:hypothetical protein